MNNNFIDLGVDPIIVKAIEEMGFVSPTNVQSRAIPHVLNHQDLVVMSKTGSGKTGAFGIPMLQMMEADVVGPQGLILTPTRELAVQVESDISLMSKYQEVTTTAVYGQHNINIEVEAINKGASIVVGTPGRVFDHIQRKTLPTKGIRFLVLDEADRMLDMGFIDQVVKIIKTLPKNRVTMLFSATMPAEIQRICQAYMNEATTIALESDTKTVDAIKQLYYRVEINEKRTQLDRLLKVEQPDSCLIFCNTRYAVDKVQAYLERKGYIVDAIHGANTQVSRMKTIEKIKKGALQIVVATDVAARGLHIDDLSLVINYDVPIEKDSYVHRIGRTGRAGNTGKAITLATADDIMTLYEIEEHVGCLIEETELPTDEQVHEAVATATGKWVGIKPPKAHAGKDHMPKEYKSKDHKPRDHKPRDHKPREYKPMVQKVMEEKAKIVHVAEPIVEKVKEKIHIPNKPIHHRKPKSEVKVETVVLPKLGPIEFRKSSEPVKKKTFLDKIREKLLK
ncbi:MAG: ATP-dependent helicase [Firmicutes bacterium HGW-Firmicutes-3]|jgi:superfamily II DNA/RNA helicase|nr:MAG: ATP-dependent helicase [Firmicutes bacterium HGW-Firmicutes-3]